MNVAKRSGFVGIKSCDSNNSKNKGKVRRNGPRSLFKPIAFFGATLAIVCISFLLKNYKKKHDKNALEN